MSVSASSTAATLRRPRWLSTVEGIRRPRVLMLLWGLVIGLVAALALLAIVPHVWTIMESRSSGMRASLAVLKEGGPLLVGRHGVNGAYYPVAMGDDPGTFTYFPLLGYLFGGVDPVVILSYFYVVAVAFVAAAYPLIFYRLTGSVLAGLAAPLMFLVCMVSIGFEDVYWIPAWGMLTLLPPLFLLARDRSRFGSVALVAIALAAGWLSSIRSSAGLGIVVIAGIVLVLRGRRWWRVLPVLAVLALAYMSTSTFIFTAIRAHRDHVLGVKTMTDDGMTQHPLYHTAYIGLGYLHNDYGIRFKDEVAAHRVEQLAPGEVYQSHAYEETIRRAYFDFVKAHPVEALRQYGAKVVVAVADAGPYLLLVALTMPAMLMFGPARRIRRLWALLALPALLIAFLQPMVAVPTQPYEEQLFGVLGVLGIVGLCWSLERAESRARERGGLPFALAGLRAAWSTRAAQRRPVSRCIRITTAAVAVLVLFCAAGYFIRQSADRWQGIPSGVLMHYLGSVSNNA